MRQRLSVILISGTLIAMGGAAMAHHSFAMFDDENQIGLEGVVQEFKYTSPHTFILLAVKAQDGSITVWNLEGVTPSALAREGWSSKSLKAGDELKMTIAPLRSGAPGGAWTPQGAARTELPHPQYCLRGRWKMRGQADRVGGRRATRVPRAAQTYRSADARAARTCRETPSAICLRHG